MCAVQGQGLYKRHKVRRESAVEVVTAEELGQMSLQQLRATSQRLRTMSQGVVSGAEKRLQKCQRIYASISRREDRVLYAGVHASCAT